MLFPPFTSTTAFLCVAMPCKPPSDGMVVFLEALMRGFRSAFSSLISIAGSLFFPFNGCCLVIWEDGSLTVFEEAEHPIGFTLEDPAAMGRMLCPLATEQPLSQFIASTLDELALALAFGNPISGALVYAVGFLVFIPRDSPVTFFLEFVFLSLLILLSVAVCLLSQSSVNF